jgi:hypothetical protein
MKRRDFGPLTAQPHKGQPEMPEFVPPSRRLCGKMGGLTLSAPDLKLGTKAGNNPLFHIILMPSEGSQGGD